MSILSALRTQSNSIDDLAKLPQAMIMQMAQKGQIREDMLAPILARKAELAQAAANTRAMQQQSARPTVMEQILNQNAMAEAPASARDMGVAQLSVRDDMYNEQRMAGGGIVAFQNNPDQPVSADMPTRDLTEEDRLYLEQNPYLQRSRGVTSFFKNVFDPNYVGEKVIGAARRFVNETPEEQAKRFRTASQARTGEIPMFSGTDLTTKGKMVAEGRMKPNESVTDVIKRERDNAQLQKELAQFDEATALFEKERAAKKPPVGGNVSTAKPAPAKVQPGKPPETPEEPLYSKYEKMLLDEREAAKADREQAKYARMLEAGLGILGGTSQYAFENIGKGAAPALKGYGEDIRGLRAEERARVKDLLGVESMRQEAKRSAQDVELKKQMIDVQRMAAGKPTSTQDIIALGRSAGMSDREIMGMIVGTSKDPEASARQLAMKSFFDSPTLQAQYKNDVNAFLKAQGLGGVGQTGIPAGLPPGTVQVGTSKGQPVYKTPDGKLVTAS